MKFNNPAEVDQVAYQMKLSDYPRSQDRALIDRLFNGFPPYGAEEVEADQVKVNVNFLEGTVIGHEARSQFYGAFLKPGRYFSCTTDFGADHKRQQRGTIVTREINRIMKRSLPYYECFRSKFALDVLHGIGPAVFRDQEHWVPQPIGVEDVLVPANTLLTMENLPFFLIRRSYTAPEFIKLTRGPKVDPGWNKTMVDSIINWIDKSAMALMGTNWPEVWSPEKQQERMKGDGGFYVGDQVPTVDVWDFYFWNDEGKKSGWGRRMILDAWGSPTTAGSMARRQGDIFQNSNQFLYTSKDRKFAEKMSNIINWQFADLSAVGPFRYHSVRSLGYLLYAVCHLQNRMRCKFNEAVFEALLMYFKVKSMDDAQRALKVELANRGFIDDTITPVPAAERWQVDSNLVMLGLNENKGIIAKNSSSYTSGPENANPLDKKEKTKYQVMAEVQQMTSLVGAALMQAYSYQTFEYREIFRRFCRSGSKDPDVREFQLRCHKAGVPEELLGEEKWEIEPERVMGAGNKTLEMTIAETLMAYRPLYDPSAQRTILRDVTMAVTDDPARAAALVPEEPEISNSVHDAQLRWGTLMDSAPVNIKDGTNHGEVVETLIGILGTKVQEVEQAGALPEPKQLQGWQNVMNHIVEEVQVVAQDQNMGPKVAEYMKVLGEIGNLIKGQQQRLEEAMQAQAGQNGEQGMDPKDTAKIQAIELMGQVKAKNQSESHAQRTAERQIAFQLKQKQKEQEHRLRLLQESESGAQKLAEKQIGTKQDLVHERGRTKLELLHEQARADQEAENAKSEE
jgi:hypothetical protein